MLNSLLRVILLTSFLGTTIAGAAGPAAAEVQRLIISGSGLLGVYGGRNYHWARGHLEGRVVRENGTEGTYRVPVTLYYPVENSNGFGFVDVVNNADFFSFPTDREILGAHSVNYTGAHILSDFLHMEGFTYLSVQVLKMTTELLGPEYGVIERGEDGYGLRRTRRAGSGAPWAPRSWVSPSRGRWTT